MRKPFYGWIIIGVCFLIGMTEAGIFQNILAIFLKPMVKEFGWSRATVTAAITFGSIGAGFASLVVGPVLDRYGPRMIAFLGILLLSAGLVGISFMKQIWQLYLFFGVGRVIGMGVLGLVVSVTVSNWFIRQRGRATGIAWLGPRAGAATLPPFIQFIILSHGWRVAWSVLGVLVFCLSAIPSLIFLRRRPEDIGLRPDGKPPSPDEVGNAGPHVIGNPDVSIVISEPEWTSAQAIRCPVFWILNFLNSMFLFANAGINFHLFPFMTDQGIPEGAAVFVLSMFAISAAVSSLLWGFLAERFEIKNLLTIEILAGSTVLLSFYWFINGRLVWDIGVGTIYILIGLYGMLTGGIMPLLYVLWADFFGRTSLGSIHGISSPFRLTANATGPIFGALCYDFLGSYTLPFYIFFSLYVLSGLIVFCRTPTGPVSNNSTS